jgi:hypothetical protein
MPTIISGGGSTGGGGTTNVTTSDQAGGKLMSFAPGDSFVVPANSVLHLRKFGFDQLGSANAITAITGVISGKLVCTCPLNPMPSSAYYLLGNSIEMDLNIQAGESLTFDYTFIYRTYGSNYQPTGVYFSGYLVPLPEASSAGQSPAYMEPQASIWWQPNVIVPVNSVSTAPVRAVALGAGKALLIRGTAIDKSTTVVDIETGTETPVYLGNESLQVGSSWYLHATYADNYKGSGKRMTRVALGSDASQANDRGGTTDLLLEMMTGTADSDFTVRSLGNVIYGGITGGRNGQAGKKVLGLAGVDYLVSAAVSYVSPSYQPPNANANGTVAPIMLVTDVYSHKIDVLPVVVTTLLTGAATIASGDTGMFSQPYYVSQTGDGIARAKGVRGRNGRLYVYLHTANSAGAVYSHTYEYVVAVIDSNGALVGSYRQTPTALTVNNGFYRTVMPATIGISEEPLGSEKLLSILPITSWGASLDVKHQQHQFAAATPAVVPGYFNKTLNGVMSTPDLPTVAEAPSATRLGSYFNRTGFNTADPQYGASSYSKAEMLQCCPGQERRNNGVIYGNAAGWYYPSGVFVEKRQYGDFGLLVGSGAVQTAVQNPVQAIASATKLLIVGVNGQMEIVTP